MSKTAPNTTCPVCGSSYYRFPSQIKRNRDITCSRTCAARHFRDKGTMANCATCGKEFYRRASLAAKGYARFCSHACERLSRPNQKVDCTCLQCGSAFKREHHSVTYANGGRFCTRACADHFKRALRKRGEQEMFTNWQKREWKEGNCIRCGVTDNLELDHIVPRFIGGKATRENAQTLCRQCNRMKFWTDDYPLYRQLLCQRVEVS